MEGRIGSWVGRDLDEILNELGGTREKQEKDCVCKNEDWLGKSLNFLQMVTLFISYFLCS